MHWSLPLGEYLISCTACFLDANLSSILCSEYAIKRIDEPFVGPSDDLKEWAL
jgi:hypothetical protein